MKRPTFIDLFAGAGGLSLGLRQAGWRPLLALDNWHDAIRTYKQNGNGEAVIEADLESLRPEELRRIAGQEPDWIVGGPPCKGFSTVGKRERDDPRNFLVFEFARVIAALRPKNVLIENVLGLRDMQFVGALVDFFGQLGYRLTPVVFKSADYGVPQLRRRIVFIGDLRGRSFLKPPPLLGPSEYVSVWDAIGDLPALKPGEAAFRYGREPFTAYQRELRNGSSRLEGHVASKHPPELVRLISYIPDGGNRQSIPPELQPKSGFHNSYSRLSSRAPAVAVTQNMGKPSGTRCIHPFQHRGLTAREGARLQGFPDCYSFHGGMTSQRLQIANAVPPVLARFLGESLLEEANWTEDEKKAEWHNGLDRESRTLDKRSRDQQAELQPELCFAW